MNISYISRIAEEQQLNPERVLAVQKLLNEGATVPFIARYRKEATNSLDEVAVTAIRDRLLQLEELEARKETILNSLTKNGHLTDEIEAKVRAAEDMASLEDIYLPFKPKKRTKATIAKEKGLLPLAERIFAQTGEDPSKAALSYIDSTKGVNSISEALEGARHIISEMVNEDPDARTKLRDFYSKHAFFYSKVIEGKSDAGAKYKDYFDWEEPVASAPSHRILAMRRGEAEDILSLSIHPNHEEAVTLLLNHFIKNTGEDSQQVSLAVQDGYKRLLSRSIETEIRVMTKEKADKEAMQIFADNLRQLLLAPPLGPKKVLAIDPGFRTGCKLACLDSQGGLKHHETIYPHSSDHQAQQARDRIIAICTSYAIEAIAIGNGTAGRETEAFVRALSLQPAIPIIMVNESGASIYSASEVAREEFPDLDLTVRGAVSIGRRLMDPLSELVKIDPKSIGVGQYQHDVDQTALKKTLDDVVISCVNAVGVDVNTASPQLLSYVSGLGPRLAKKIVLYRDDHGPFFTREALKKVPRLGPKAFEQAAGFLRILNGDNILDRSAVHPESYPIVHQMAQNLACQPEALIQEAKLRENIDISRYVTDTIGLPTLRDILAELAKPGRDPRKEFQIFAFAGGIEKISDLTPGMKLPGIVTNVTAFGAFVDIGVHQDGLVHISELADHFVKDPKTMVKVQQKVMVTVKEVDIDRKRIALSMKKEAISASSPSTPSPDNRMRQKKMSPAPQKKKKQAANTPFNNPFDVLKKSNF